MNDAARRKPGKVLCAVKDMQLARWIELLSHRRDVVTPEDDLSDPDIRFAVVWRPDPGLLAGLKGLEVIFSMGAGVDRLLEDPTIPDLPIVRVVDPSLTSHMVEFVLWRVLDHHRQGRLYREQQAARHWRQHKQWLAREVTVGVMGFGVLGRAAASRLLQLGFRVAGWSRSGATMEGVTTFGGEDGLPAFLTMTDILVVLLPLTDATRGIIDYDLLRRLRRDGPLGGPVLINAGRGQLQREDDIVRALDDGILFEASLDVFAVEPLPADSPLWTHPRVFATPHVAAESDPGDLAPVMLDQMDAFERGEPLVNVVDRNRGY